MFKRKDDRTALSRLMELPTGAVPGAGEADGQVMEDGMAVWRKFTVSGTIVGPFIVHRSHIRGEQDFYRITHRAIGYSCGITSKNHRELIMLAGVLARLPGWAALQYADIPEETKDQAAHMREMFKAQRWANLLMMVTE